LPYFWLPRTSGCLSSFGQKFISVKVDGTVNYY
jgi:hypothetical protein